MAYTFFFVWALGFKRKIYLGVYLKKFAHSFTITGQKAAQVVLALYMTTETT